MDAGDTAFTTITTTSSPSAARRAGSSSWPSMFSSAITYSSENPISRESDSMNVGQKPDSDPSPAERSNQGGPVVVGTSTITRLSRQQLCMGLGGPTAALTASDVRTETARIAQSFGQCIWSRG